MEDRDGMQAPSQGQALEGFLPRPLRRHVKNARVQADKEAVSRRLW